ncbi:MAG TPA: alpha/beta hydrolase [Xanthobacteraceae bacterium]|jgi:arylformamidase|nr:alpha/beta hydrolase [Xanthobacteraceae bacterium]
MQLPSGTTAGSTALYRGMDRPALDAAYNNSAAVADSAQWVARWREQSAMIRARSGNRLDLRYGPRPRARLDYFPSGNKNAPLFAFIHGGYWQRNEKETFAFVAEGPRAHGIDVALIGYTLTPDVRLTELVDEIRASLSYLADQSGELGFNRKQLFVSGWSAGGHLTAAVADHPAFCGGMPISGIFDLEPIALNYLNEKILLDAAEVAALSPLRHISSGLPALRIIVGGDELPELRRQSEEYAAAAKKKDVSAELSVLKGHHHFSILDEIAKPDGAMTKQLVELIAATK